MKRSSNKFLHRVRIHGGEFDASARAMHRDGMASSFQAAVETVSIATIERKQMSTKTTFKRVALVTVAALGFGVLTSVAPSQATTYSDSLALSATTASQLTGETATSTSVVATLTYLADAATDSMSVTVTLVSAPAGNTALPMLKLTETTTASAESPLASPLLLTATTGVAANVPVFVIPAGFTAAMNVTAKVKVYMNAPSKVGTYVVSLTPAITSGAGTKQSAAQTVTITVAANPNTDTVATSATSILTAGDTTTSSSGTVSPTTDDVVTGSKTVSTSDPAATIKVSLKNAAGIATTGESYTATITGSGTLGSGPMTTTSTAAATGRAITVKAGDVVQVFPDGTSGVATITINSALGVVLATEKVTFFGDATTIVATVATTVLAVGDNTGAITAVVKDAAGTVVSNAALVVTSDATTKVSGSYTAGKCSFTSATQDYACTITGVAAGTANITIGTKASATATTGVEAAKVSVRVGSTTAASIAWTLDKSSYAPGEKATLTATLLDSTGLLVGAGDYTSIMKTGGLKPSRELGASSDTLTATTIHSVADGVRNYTIYMPLTEGDLKITGTTAGTAVTGTAPSALSGLLVANQAAAISITASVVSASGSAATDAANEATDAANAATDAANAAAEAADAATAAAQDAADAVAALSTEVAGLIAALKAQITSLTNLVIKIQKKIKA